MEKGDKALKKIESRKKELAAINLQKKYNSNLRKKALRIENN